MIEKKKKNLRFFLNWYLHKKELNPSKKINQKKSRSLYRVVFSLWQWWYYPHRVRDSVSTVCGIFVLYHDLLNSRKNKCWKVVSEQQLPHSERPYLNERPAFMISIIFIGPMIAYTTFMVLCLLHKKSSSYSKQS